MEKIKPFRFWCQKVLPLVYDDSLSYYELLCKVVTHLNNTTSAVNELGENVSDMVAKFNELKEYVENTITETVDEEIDKKLDEYFAEHFFVTSINGEHGDITLTAADVGATPNNYGAQMAGKILAIGVDGSVMPIDAPEGGVISVNGKSGNVILNHSDVGAVKEFFGEDYAGEVLLISSDGRVTSGAIDTDAIEAGSITLEKLANVGSENAGKVFKIDSNGDVALGESGGGGTGGAVESVNGKTGVVVLNAQDVHALSEDVEELPNPFKLTFSGAVSAEYDGSQDVTVNIPQGGGDVESVNGKTGVVVLSAEDVGALAEVPDTYRTSAEQDNIDNALSDRINAIEVAKFPNAVIVGDPLINGSSVSLFSDNNYMVFPFIVDVRGYAFTIDFCFRTGEDVTTQQNIIDSRYGIALAIQGGKGVIALSSNGENWNIGNTAGNYNILPNTVYYARVSWDGETYKTALSTDGVEYTDDMTISSTLGLFPTTVYIGGAPNIFGAGTAHPFFGVIDMSKAKLTVAGLEVWHGMDDPGLASRASVSLSNLDAQGLEKFKAENLPYGDTNVGATLTAHENSIDTIETAVDEKVNIVQGVEKSGQFLVVGEDGNVTTQSFETWDWGTEY